MRKVLFWLLVSVPVLVFAAPEAADDLYVLLYSPGSNWDETLDYDAQPGIRAHAEHLMGLYDANILLLGGSLDGGRSELVVIQAKSRAQADKIAARDPAVINKVLNAEVKEWTLEMSAMRKFRRTVPQISDPYGPFRLERESPESPINIKD
ncbi:MAG: hypothetical protein WD002_06790 [Pseudomonadales bacterium]